MTTNEMRKKNFSSTDKIDGISIVLTIAFSAVIGLLSVIPIVYFFGFWFGLLAFILITALTLSLIFIHSFVNIQKVPEGYVWIIEFFGGFKVIWSAGGHMYFSLFNWLEHRAEVYLGEKHIELFPDPNDLIDLEDTSCHFKALIIIKVANPLLAIYNIDDYKFAVRGRVAGLLRSHLSKYTLDKANEEKHELDLGYIISGEKNDPNYKKKEFYTEILNDWGIELLKLVVSDLELSLKDITQRQRKQDNEINRETAKANKEIEVIASEGKAKAIENIATAKQFELAAEGFGIAEQIEALVKTGIPIEAAREMIIDRYKWGKIGDKSLIIEGGNNSVAGDGAKFGAGMEKGKNINNKSKD